MQLHSIPDRRMPGRAQQWFRPGVGRTNCRVFPTAAMRDEYEAGWQQPDDYRPAACGTPAQQGALDRLMEARS